MGTAGSGDRGYMGDTQGVAGAALLRACPSQFVMDSSPEMPSPPQETRPWPWSTGNQDNLGELCPVWQNAEKRSNIANTNDGKQAVGGGVG